MNRLWVYQDQGGMHTITDDEIIDVYYPYWQTQMRKVDKASLINPESCIEDFTVVHWAWEANDS